MLIFSSGPGRIVAVPGIGTPLTITLENWPGFDAMQAILTGVGLASEANAQFLHTLRRFVYVYLFGEALGEIQLHGLAATYTPCDARPGTHTGLERVFDYYNRFRLSAIGAPLNLALGSSIRLKFFCTGTRLDHSDPTNGLAQFSLQGKSAVFSLDGGRPSPLTAVPPSTPRPLPRGDRFSDAGEPAAGAPARGVALPFVSTVALITAGAALPFVFGPLAPPAAEPPALPAPQPPADNGDGFLGDSDAMTRQRVDVMLGFTVRYLTEDRVEVRYRRGISAERALARAQERLLPGGSEAWLPDGGVVASDGGFDILILVRVP